jgi:hypothetical protein
MNALLAAASDVKPRPEGRARRLESAVDALRLYPECDAGPALVPADVQADIERTAGEDWLPLEDDVLVSHAIERALGASAARDFAHADGLKTFRGPFFRALAESARQNAQGDLWELSRWMARAYWLAFRGCGRWQHGALDDEVRRMRIVEVPALCIADGAWVRRTVGALSAMPLLGGFPAELVVTAIELRERRVELELRSLVS